MTNNIYFFHRLRKKTQAFVKVGFLSFFTSKDVDIIYPYLSIKDEKIYRVVFNLGDEFNPEVEAIKNLKNKSPLEIAKAIFDEKIDVLIVFSDNKVIKDVLNFKSAPIIIVAASDLNKTNTLPIDDILGNKIIYGTVSNDNIGIFSAFFNTIITLNKDVNLVNALKANLKDIIENSPVIDNEFLTDIIKLAVFTSFNYLASLKEQALNKKETKLLLETLNKLDPKDIANRCALADRIILTKPTDKKMVDELALIYANDNLENLKEAADLFPKKYLSVQFCRFLIAKYEQRFDDAEKIALSIKNSKSTDYNDEYFIYKTIQLLADMYTLEMGKVEDALDLYLQTIKITPDAYKEKKSGYYSNYLLLLNYTNCSSEIILNAAKKINDFFKDVKRFSHNKHKNKKIKIGYISPDFRNHVVANFSLAFFNGRDKNKFETYAYFLKNEDDITEIFKKSADIFKNVSNLSHYEIAKIIYEDKIDILVDLAGHTSGNALPILAYKPAPIQICGIGYFATTGLNETDYFIVDKYLAPNEEDKHFTEKLLRLPHSHFCYTPVNNIPEKNSILPFEKNNFITFGSMNKADKITDDVVETWANILKSVQNSKLFLKFKSYDNPDRIEKEKSRFQKFGIDTNRIEFEGATKDYLKEYNRMDIALDTFPYPGGGTTCDALVMGVPVVTLSGKNAHERFGKSILCNLKLDELVANNLDEYVDIAVKLANDMSRLKKLHSEIPKLMKNSAVMNQKIYMKDLEEVYIKIYENWGQ